MKFLCLGYLNHDAFEATPQAEKDAILNRCFAQCVSFRQTGKVLIEEGLEPPVRTKSIRSRKGQPTVTDGPFIETKEQLGSFFVVEAENIDEAITVASLHPAALMGEEYGFGIHVIPLQ